MNLQELFVNELRDLYNAEKQLVKALPKMAKAASNQDLKTAYQEHTEQTKGQLSRLEQVFEHLGQKARGQTCEAMQGLIQEGQEIMDEAKGESVGDVGMVAASEKIEHYEISGYESAWMMAKMMGLNDVADLLQQTLREEQETAQRLNKINRPLLKEASRGAETVAVQARGRGGEGRAATRGHAQGRSRSGRGRGAAEEETIVATIDETPDIE